MKAALAGAGILVTRPLEQTTTLARLIRDAGGEPILFPALEIEPLPPTVISPFLERLQHFDLLIFVSPNSVRVALPNFLKHADLPSRTKVAALGPATAAELKKFEVRNIISPREGFDSEALLAELSTMPLEGGRVLIVRGQGGRELLAERLRSRGAIVEYLECYRRINPDRDMRELMRRDCMKACLATSSDIVENLFSMAGAVGRSWLCSMPFFVPHPRVASAAFCLGVQCVFVTGNGDEALVDGVQTWFARSRPFHDPS